MPTRQSIYRLALGSAQCYLYWFRPSCLGRGNNSVFPAAVTRTSSILSLPPVSPKNIWEHSKDKAGGPSLGTATWTQRTGTLTLLSRLAFPTPSHRCWARPHLRPSVWGVGGGSRQAYSLALQPQKATGKREVASVGCHPRPRAGLTGRSPAAVSPLCGTTKVAPLLLSDNQECPLLL